MNVYYRRETTWHKWPDNDQKDTDVVKFSLKKRPREFNDQVFLTLEPSTDPRDRKRLVAEALGKPEKQITLLKTN